MKNILLASALTLNFVLLSLNSSAQAPNQPGAGNCLSFNGTTNYVGNIGTTASYSFIQNTGVFTIESWIKIAPSSSSYPVIISNAAGSAEKGFYMAYNTAISMLEMGMMRGVFGSATFASSIATTIFQDMNFHHVAASGNGTSVSFFVDGILIGTNSITGPLSTGNSQQPLLIGNDIYTFTGITTDYNFSGNIDEVRIWNTARTQTEIRDNMCKKLVGNELGLVGYWRFDETTGNIAFDSQTNVAPNDGTGF